jgi:hypothetical protein
MPEFFRLIGKRVGSTGERGSKPAATDGGVGSGGVDDE